MGNYLKSDSVYLSQSPKDLPAIGTRFVGGKNPFSGIQDTTPGKVPDENSRETIQLSLMSYLNKHPNSSVEEISRELGLTYQQVSKNCSLLYSKGLLGVDTYKTPGRVVNTYTLSCKTTPPTGLSVLEFLQKNPGSTASQVRKAVNRGNIYVVLAKLHKAGYLLREQDAFNADTGKLCYRYWRNI